MQICLAVLVASAIGTIGVAEAAPDSNRRDGAHRHHTSARPVAGSAGPIDHLLSARTAVGAARVDQADDALGRAETRLLNDAAIVPDRTPPFGREVIADIVDARASASRRRRPEAVQAINAALLALEPQRTDTASAPRPLPPAALVTVAPIELMPPAPRPIAPDPAPVVLYRLEPGRWQLQGARSVWIAPQTIPQPVSVRPVVAVRQVWNGDRWVLVPEHLAETEPGQ